MMRQKAQIRQTACLVLLVYLFLSGFMMVGAGSHAVTHQNGTHHAAQHASFVCAWMCAASSFVHTADPNPSQRFNPTFENLPTCASGLSDNLSILSFHIRPPPTALS